VATTQADLKSAIGWDTAQPLPKLEADTTPPPSTDLTLDQAIAQGIQNRPDLLAQRLRVESQAVSLRSAQANARGNWTIDATASKSFAPNVADRSGLGLQASIPLFDGWRTRETVRQERLGLEAERVALVQDERDVRAEIESAYKADALNRQRLEASRLALAAAQKNYEAVLEAQRQGAANLVELITAQVSLVTAESNMVEATYDQLITAVQLRLAIGQPVPGETE
jgi:outer membrane protein